MKTKSTTTKLVKGLRAGNAGNAGDAGVLFAVVSTLTMSSKRRRYLGRKSKKAPTFYSWRKSVVFVEYDLMTNLRKIIFSCESIIVFFETASRYFPFKVLTFKVFFY